MTLFARLCGTVAGIYLVYLAAFFPENQANASTAPAMAITLSEEHAAMEALRIDYLQAYDARYSEYPAVLQGSRWVSVLDNQKTCTQNPEKVWTFTGRPNAGHICKPKTLGNIGEYDCDVTNMFGKTSQQDFTMRFGDTILPDWALERPHITLTRGGWRKKTIGLQMCESSAS